MKFGQSYILILTKMKMCNLCVENSSGRLINFCILIWDKIILYRCLTTVIYHLHLAVNRSHKSLNSKVIS